MADNIKGIPFSTEDEGFDYPQRVKEFVFWESGDDVRSMDDIYVVWFTYVLGNWKALCSTSVADGKYYEVTYNAAKGETYVDTYVKTKNTAWEDNE